MKNIKLNNGIRIVLFLCGIMLIFVLFKPIWKIELSAPQYPEGLMMNINANGLGGDVAIINGLNHYIGMKTLHNEDFIEFKILPYVISIFALFFFIVAIIRNRKLMYLLFGLFVLFGAVAMIDFWKWEYNYGHNLDPNAAIIVPGMAYQPPLIGYKQLLNFGAYSIPDVGGWLFIIAGILLLSCIVADYRVKRKVLKLNIMALSLSSVLIMLFSGCSVEPEPIKIGSDNCHYCKMGISDNKFGAEVITTKGKIFKYDELHCLRSEIEEGGLEMINIKDIYFTDFCDDHKLIKSENSFYLKSSEINAPMGGDIATFSKPESLKTYQKQLGGEEVTWNQIIPVK
jgi:copper chaperone NosL